MYKWSPWLLLVCISHSSALVTQLLRGVTSDVSNTVTVLVTPAEDLTINTLLQRCQLLQSLASEKNEPDLSQLTLNYIIGDKQYSYSLDNVTAILDADWYDEDEDLVIFFHGFTDKPLSTNFHTINVAYQKRGDYNIMALDASSQINNNYPRSSRMVKFIGNRVATALQELESSGLRPQQIHLVGHSLGAHIAGNVGRQYTALTNKKLARITGLDPAGPCYEGKTDLKLDKNDAEFVDIIHTDAGVYGLYETVGDVDFWPNGGSQQPDCSTCSHGRVIDLFAESVTNTEAFPAVKCDSWNDFKHGKCNTSDVVYMGLGTTPSDEGSYYLQTGNASPYALGQQGTEYSSNRGVVTSVVSVIVPSHVPRY